MGVIRGLYGFIRGFVRLFYKGLQGFAGPNRFYHAKELSRVFRPIRALGFHGL